MRSPGTDHTDNWQGEPSFLFHHEPELELNRVIRHSATHAFFSHGDWTPDFAAADKFADTLSILKTFLQHKLKDVELLLVFGNHPSPADIVLPLREQSPGGQISCRPFEA